MKFEAVTISCEREFSPVYVATPCADEAGKTLKGFAVVSSKKNGNGCPVIYQKKIYATSHEAAIRARELRRLWICNDQRHRVVRVLE